jgi:hypothetical protein
MSNAEGSKISTRSLYQMVIGNIRDLLSAELVWDYAESGPGTLDTGASLTTFQGLQASRNLDLESKSHSIPSRRVSKIFWCILVSRNVVVCLEDEFARHLRVAVCTAQNHIWTVIRLSVSVSGYRSKD